MVKVNIDGVDIELTGKDAVDFEASRAGLSIPSINDYQLAIQSLVDITAISRQYADGVTLASYSASTNPTWAAQAAAFMAWRDKVWLYAYTELGKVTSGQRPQPSISEFISELPIIVWPN